MFFAKHSDVNQTEHIEKTQSFSATATSVAAKE